MLNRIKLTVVLGVMCIAMSGCASHSHELKAANVSTAGYEKLSCNELKAEITDSVNRVRDLTGVIDGQAKGDEAAVAVAMILFWPAVFAIDGDTEESAEFSRVKGEINAMEKVAVMNNCGEVESLVKEFRAQEEKARLAKLEAEKSRDLDPLQ